MTAYVVQRLGTVMVIMVAMSLLVFLATHALPSNTAALILGQYSTPETQAALEHKLGLDLPLPVQYWHWAKGMIEGDMGQSLVMERPIAPMLWDAFGKSAILAVSAMAVVAIVGPTLGVIAAVRSGQWPDHAASIFTYLGISVPEFYWGLVLILVFGGTLHILPTAGAGEAIYSASQETALVHGWSDDARHAFVDLVAGRAGRHRQPRQPLLSREGQ